MSSISTFVINTLTLKLNKVLFFFHNVISSKLQVLMHTARLDTLLLSAYAGNSFS